jgi:hypothetical protein
MSKEIVNSSVPKDCSGRNTYFTKAGSPKNEQKENEIAEQTVSYPQGKTTN